MYGYYESNVSHKRYGHQRLEVYFTDTWCRHQMEKFSALLARYCAGNSLSPEIAMPGKKVFILKRGP